MSKRNTRSELFTLHRRQINTEPKIWRLLGMVPGTKLSPWRYDKQFAPIGFYSLANFLRCRVALRFSIFSSCTCWEVTMPSRLTLECGYRDDHSAFYSCLSHCFDRLIIISLTIRISMVDEHFFVLFELVLCV